MKKLFSLLSIMFLIFGFNLNVKADMGPPTITEYDIRIKDIEGTTAYNDWDNSSVTIPYDSVLTVTFESNVDGVLFGQIMYNEKDYLIDLSKVEIIKKVIDLSKWEKKPQKMYVYKDGAYLYNGPSKVYGKVNGNVELPVGTTIEFEYSDGVWAYVEYKGTKGWVYIYSYKENGPYKEVSSLLNASNDTGSIFTVSDVKLETYPGSEIYTGVTIPKFTNVNFKYLYEYESHTNYYYVEYNGQGGWVYGDAYIIGSKFENSTVYTLKDTKLYGDDKKTVYTTIPKHTELKALYEALDTDYSAVGYVYVEYKGIKGWVYFEDGTNSDVALNWDNDYYTYKILVNAKLYDKIDGKLINKEIPANTKIEIKYCDWANNWYYVVTKNYQGWINISSEDMEYIYNDDSEQEIIYPEVKPEEEIINPEVRPEEENKTEEKEDVPELPKVSPKEMAIYCISGAVVLALVAFVTIKLINKKKKTNTTEIVTDTENNNNE